MSVYIGGRNTPGWRETHDYLLGHHSTSGDSGAVQHCGLDIGKWLQNAGAFHYVRCVMLVALGLIWPLHRGQRNAFSWPQIWPEWPPDIDKLNFWSSIAFAFYRHGTGLRHERRDFAIRAKTFPRAIYAPLA